MVSSCVLFGFDGHISSAAAGFQYTNRFSHVMRCVFFTCHALRLMLRIARCSAPNLNAQVLMQRCTRKTGCRANALRAAARGALARHVPCELRVAAQRQLHLHPNAARARSCSSRPRARAFCFRRRQRRRQHRSARDVRAHVGPAGVYPADDC